MTKRKKLVKGLWSKDDVKLLKKLFANRKTQEVADELFVSSQSVAFWKSPICQNIMAEALMEY